MGKDYLLCENCEQRFSAYEKAFAEKAFIPYHENTITEIEYAHWGMKFAASIVWRMLASEGSDEKALSHFSQHQVRAAHEAEKHWREFLLDRRSNPGPYELHVLLLDAIASHTMPNLSPFMNRYLVRAVEFDIIASRSMAMVYAKMCRILVLGFISVKRASNWRTTKLHVKKGSVGGRISADMNLFNYMNDRANLGASMFAGLSPRQKETISKALMSNLEALKGSEILRAMNADIALSGREAFRVTGPDTEAKKVYEGEQDD